MKHIKIGVKKQVEFFEEEINGIIKCCDITFRKINKKSRLYSIYRQI